MIIALRDRTRPLAQSNFVRVALALPCIVASIGACGDASSESGLDESSAGGPAGASLAGVSVESASAWGPGSVAWKPVACTGVRATGPAVLCVDAKSTLPPTGAAEHPYRDLVTAAANAKNGDTILVARGAYSGNLAVVNGRGLEIYGGFPGAGNFGCRNPSLYPTKLVGAPNGGAVLAFYNAPKVAIDGFTISGGTGNFDGYYYKGGGIFADTDPGTPSIVAIANNIVESNNVVHSRSGHETRGGGIYLDGVGGVVESNVIRNNHAGRGGGIAWAPALNGILRNNSIEHNTSATSVDEGHPVSAGLYMAGTLLVSGNHIASNLCSNASDFGWGGGVYGFQGTFTMTGNTITDNFAPNQGSGAFFEQTVRLTLENELYYANRCPMRGGAALYFDQNLTGSPPGPTVAEILSSTIVDHVCSPTDGGNAIYAEGGSSVTVKDSIVWNNGTSDFYTAPGTGTRLSVGYTLTDGAFPGIGNFQADPLFADPKTHDYALKSRTGRWSPSLGKWIADAVTSPAVDRGDPAAPYSKEPAPNGHRLNLGHQGNTALASKSP